MHFVQCKVNYAAPYPQSFLVLMLPTVVSCAYATHSLFLCVCCKHSFCSLRQHQPQGAKLVLKSWQCYLSGTFQAVVVVLQPLHHGCGLFCGKFAAIFLSWGGGGGGGGQKVIGISDSYAKVSLWVFQPVTAFGDHDSLSYFGCCGFTAEFWTLCFLEQMIMFFG